MNAEGRNALREGVRRPEAALQPYRDHRDRSGTLEEAVAFPTGQQPVDAAAGDFDGGGRPDLVTANGKLDLSHNNLRR